MNCSQRTRTITTNSWPNLTDSSPRQLTKNHFDVCGSITVVLGCVPCSTISESGAIADRTQTTIFRASSRWNLPCIFANRRTSVSRHCPFIQNKIFQSLQGLSPFRKFGSPLLCTEIASGVQQCGDMRSVDQHPMLPQNNTAPVHTSYIA
jgi:hypothetical protein